MGNHHSGNHGTSHHVDFQINELQKRDFVMRRRQKLDDVKRRRQSMPLERLVINANTNTKHSNFASFAYGDKEESLHQALTPRIQINGQESCETLTPIDPTSNHNQTGNNSAAVSNQNYFEKSTEPPDNQMQFKSPLATNGIREKNPSASTVKPHRFIRNPKSAATRRMEFLSFANNFVVRSLDDTSDIQSFDIDMKPLSHRARSMSPLKQLRTYSFGSVGRRFPSDESVLTPEVGCKVIRTLNNYQIQHCALIKASWNKVNEQIVLNHSHPFGFLVLKRVLEKMPSLRTAFKLENYSSIMDIPEDHSFSRHTGLFQSMIDLSVRNAEELETEIAPALFIYGRRHFEHDLVNLNLQPAIFLIDPFQHGMFNEETVRLFCGQVVCAVLDILGNSMSTESMEAWIEFMRYLGRALLNGYEFELLNSKKKFKFSTSNHKFFIA